MQNKQSIFICKYSVLKQTYRARKYPDKIFGSLSFILLRIWLARVSTRAILPSLLCGVPVKMDLRLSVSARQAVSKEFSLPPDCADAIETDWPISATHGISVVFGGPWFERRAWTAASAFGFSAAWSILLIIPTVLVPINREICEYCFVLVNFKKIQWFSKGNRNTSKI